MYAEHFGLKEAPFDNTPNPRFFFSTPDHEEALASLIYTVHEAKGYVVLTGDVGTGKTMVTRMMLAHFGDAARHATIHHRPPDPRELLIAICMEFGIKVRSGLGMTQMLGRLHDYLLQGYAAGQPTVLILDEAQLFSSECLELARTIGNLDAEDSKLIQVILCGQPELEALIQTPPLRPLLQRIFRSFHLRPLSEARTRDYIAHRLEIAGLQGESPFSEAACVEIHRWARGLPRLINTLCDNLMISAYADNLHTLEPEAVAGIAASVLPGRRPPPSTSPEFNAVGDASQSWEFAKSRNRGPAPGRPHRPAPTWVKAGDIEHRLRELAGRVACIEKRGFRASPTQNAATHMGPAKIAPVAMSATGSRGFHEGEMEGGHASLRRPQLTKMASVLRDLISHLKSATANLDRSTTPSERSSRMGEAALGRPAAQRQDGASVSTTRQSVIPVETKRVVQTPSLDDIAAEQRRRLRPSAARGRPLLAEVIPRMRDAFLLLEEALTG